MPTIADPVPLVPTRFRMIRPLAQGGFSAVYLARDEELNRTVVVKAMRGKYARRPWARDRLLFEAEVTAGLEHPGVVPVYTRGIDKAGHAYFTMRYVRGEPMAAAIEGLHAEGSAALRRRITNRLADRLIDVCYTVDFAHRRGIAHRDLTPTNVMLGEHGETLVLDWGLARLITPTAELVAPSPDLEECSGEEEWPSVARDEEGTRIGVSLGTPRYMSPEQAAGRWDRFGPRSDVFALGAILYELMTGRAPYEHETRSGSTALARRAECPTPREIAPKTPAALETICLKAMMREPEARYGDPVAMGTDLGRWVSGEPISVSRAATLKEWKSRRSG